MASNVSAGRVGCVTAWLFLTTLRPEYDPLIVRPSGLTSKQTAAFERYGSQSQTSSGLGRWLCREPANPPFRPFDTETTHFAARWGVLGRMGGGRIRPTGRTWVKRGTGVRKGKETTLRRLKRTLVAGTAAALLLVSVTVAPTFAFIHDFIPAGQCAASDMAGDNETAEAHLPRVPIETPPAPDTCPAPQK
jgi:hypothetical protein